VLCDCGAFIKRPAVRCKRCAVEFVRGIDTDRFDRVVEEVEQIMTLNDSQQVNAKAVQEWHQFQKDLRTQRFLRKAAVVGILLVIALCGFIAWRVIR
jgi:hypothetical protein